MNHRSFKTMLLLVLVGLVCYRGIAMDGQDYAEKEMATEMDESTDQIDRDEGLFDGTEENDLEKINSGESGVEVADQKQFTEQPEKAVSGVALNPPLEPVGQPSPDTSNIVPMFDKRPPVAENMNIQIKPSNNNKGELMAKEVKLGMDGAKQMAVAESLQKLLANEFVLYVKTLNFHWNIEGKFFGPLHTFFNNQYDKLAETIDAIAERIRALGLMSRATLQEFMKESSLKETPGEYPDDVKMLTLLLADHEAVIRQLREINAMAQSADDAGTTNFVSGLLEMHEKMAWMIRAHVNR
ncbi:DNA starvation/stationary phase protection protein [bacterium]|nr:MAG: DNA starvation/stationary phase protection protein [bacterium]QQR61917.1 MAG: DNA starvation/stationary phase protection protein [bacterium]